MTGTTPTIEKGSKIRPVGSAPNGNTWPAVIKGIVPLTAERQKLIVTSIGDSTSFPTYVEGSHFEACHNGIEVMDSQGVWHMVPEPTPST